MEKKLDLLFGEIVELQKDKPLNKLNKLELKWIHKGAGEYPCCTTAIKAAQLRDLVPAVAELCKKYSDGSEEDRWRLYCVQNLERYYKVLETPNQFLSDEEFKTLGKAVDRLLMFYSKLSGKAQKERKKLWSEVFKFHHFWHLAQQARYQNPRKFWTYMSEDFVGKISKLDHSLLHGTAPWKVPIKIAYKYRFAMHFWLRRQWRSAVG